MTASENIGRALRCVGLADDVDLVAEAADRVFYRPSPRLRGKLVTRGWTRDPVSPEMLHAGAEESWREPGAVMPALQICFLRGGLVEADLDFAAPLGGDVVSAVVHFGEFLWHTVTGTRTNQRRMARALDRRFGKDDGKAQAA